MDETLLLTYLRGECSDEESRQVEAWCEASLTNRQTLEHLYYTIFVGERMAAMEAVDTEASLRNFKQALCAKQKKASWRSRSIDWRRLTTVAAAFLAGLIFAGGIGWGVLSNKLADYSVITTAGQRAQAVLPDGSKVWLNASTKLVYHNSFWSSERLVDLSGEAYFEVAHDKHTPFRVNSKQIKTCVLGTKFNVRARQEEDRVVTTLLQGSVRVDSPQTLDDGYVLNPGQTLSVNTENYQTKLIEYAKPDDVLLWMNELLVFKQSSLLEITNVMEKLYDVQFVYKEDDLRLEQFTGEFSTDSTPNEILDILIRTNHFDYKKKGRLITLMKK